RRELAARHVVLASGSVPTELKSVPFDGKQILDSWDALELEEVPKRLAIVGAGVIGLELGSVWRRLGSEVMLLEALPEFLATSDRQLAREALRHFKRQGLDIRLGAKVAGATCAPNEVTVAYEDAEGSQRSGVDRLVVAVGRRPNTR